MSRGLLVWAVIMTAETIHGILRGLFLVPRVGEVMAGRIGWPIAVIIVFAVTSSCIKWTKIRGTAGLLRLGAFWAVLTFIFETGIGVLRGLDALLLWAEINPLAGGLMLYSLAAIFLAPLFAARMRNVS